MVVTINTAENDSNGGLEQETNSSIKLLVENPVVEQSANNRIMMDHLGQKLNDLNTARDDMGRSRNSNSSFMFWWSSRILQVKQKTESWNGTNWTEVNDLNTARRGLVGSNWNYDICYNNWWRIVQPS